MKIERKQLSGVMNLDDTNDVIPGSHHKEARNLVFRGSQGGLSAQNILGNRNIATSLPAGTNSCIGSYYDSQKQRLFYFNYNSNSNHGIYIYNTIPKTIQVLFLNNTHSATDVLGFNINNPITSINIMYNDSYKSSLDLDGDVLYWVDSLGRPSKLNIDRKLAGVYTSYKRSYLDVAKAPPSMPVKCAYEYDNNVTNNNLRNSLFQFIYRWVYDDGEKSVWSTGSMVPLPWIPFMEEISRSPNSNSRINMFMSTGDETVKKIEIAVRKCSDGVTSDYELITSLNKKDASLLIPNNSVYSYLFYNNVSLIPIDKAEQISLFDYVPQKANAQELLNGNTLVYGGITEGYDNITNVNTTLTSNTTTQDFSEVPGAIFFAQQNGVSSYGGTSSIDIFLTGMGGNDVVTNVPTAIPSVGYGDFYIKFRNSAGNLFTIFFDSTTSDTIANILAGLQADAILQGFSATISGNKLTISDTNTLNLESAYMINSLSAISHSTTKQFNALYVHQGNSNYRYGIVYYDDKGRTNGVVTSDGLKITTPKWTGSTLYPFVQISISHQPPLWASYYNIVRTDNLTYDKNIFWVSNRAFTKLTTRATSSTDFSISYIGISNMIQYNEDIQSTSGYVGYDFAAGDRIRFTERVSADGTIVSLPDNLDFEIIGVESNPNINGYVAEGTYVKIKYPSVAINANFKLLEPDPVVYAGTATAVEDFQNYKIQIYSYKKPSTSIDVYYEIGHQYAVSQPGTVNRYHVGQSQSQTASLPALVYLTSGDEFFRYRNIPIGANYSFTAGQYGQGDSFGAYAGRYRNINVNVWGNDNTTKTISNSIYEIKSQVLGGSTTSLLAIEYPNFVTPDCLFRNKSGVTQTVRVIGKIPVSTITSNANYIAIHAKVVLNSTTAAIYPVLKRVAVTEANRQYEFEFDAKITVPAGAKLFLMTETHDDVGFKINVGAFDLKLDVVNNTQIAIIEKSFSDINKIEINAKSRPVVFDENAKQSYYPTLIRFGLQKEAGTDVNNSNRFSSTNMDEYDREKGDIVRFKVRGSKMRVFQKRACGMVGVLENMIYNADGNSNLIQTNKLLNQIHYYQGEYGIGNLPTSLASSARADYFVDPIRGYQLRLSDDGLTPISSLYKAQFYITSLANKYITNTAGTLGGFAKVLGVYDFYEEEYISVFQGYSGQANTTLGFSELRNSYTSFYDFAPEWITSTEGSIVSFRNGQLYVHDSNTYCNFYGTQYKPSIKLVFNDIQTIKKRYNTISMLCNKKWVPDTNGDITTNLGQSSSLQEADFIYKDDKLHASFKRDANSTGGLINGNVLKGNWAQINLKPVNGNEFVNLFYIELNILEPFYNR
jgi:hypothetical protein